MKKLYLLAISLFITAFAFSQEIQKITWGIQAGINTSAVTVKDHGLSSTTTSKIGLNAGIDVQIPIATEGLSIQPELNFSQMGGRLPNQTAATADSVAVLVKSRLIENYIALPILIKYKIPNTGLGIYLGPQYSFLLNAKNNQKFTNLSTSSNTDITKYYQRSDFAAIFGAEYYLPVGIGISARYQLGFLNTAKIVEDKTESVKNHGFTFSVGYRF